MIIICNKNDMPKNVDGTVIYIGRGSPLGNPFKMTSETQRDWSCDRYEIWFREQLRLDNKDVLRQFLYILTLHKKGENVYLQCYCAPKRCHGDTLKAYLERC